MVFNSINYFLFLAVTLFLFYSFPARYRWLVLLCSSVFFFALNNIYFLLVVFGIIGISYWGAKYISKNNTKDRLNISYIFIFLIILLPLLFFKYSVFIADNVLFLFNHSSNYGTNNLFNVIIPIGISYYTFQALSYIIDVRYGMAVEQNFWMFSLYMIFFPKILMGPIERSRKFLPQVNKKLFFQEDNFSLGLKLILLGLLKKLVIADRISIYTDAVFSNYIHHDGVTLLVASLFYTVQLYTDFSGYTDIALGSARLFGIKLTDNFNRPFFATSMTEFWRRWHITLTKWLTDYVFTSIVLKWRYWGRRGLMLAGIITFLIIGIWHGAGWNFVVFGLLNGIAFAFEILTQDIRKKITKSLPSSLYNLLFMILTFLYFTFTLIFLNASSISQAYIILNKILTFSGKLKILEGDTFYYSIAGTVFLFTYEFIKEFYNRDIIIHLYKYELIRIINYSLLIIIILLFGAFNGGQFIYFKF